MSGLTKSQQCSLAFGNHVRPETARAAWAAVTAAPGIRTRTLAAQLDIAPSHAAAALRMLRAAGYIAFEDGTAGAREIIVPFREVRP